ncbi:MAG TPA: peroxiredoxin [Aestuariivirga sp.]|nr:peroxiredoxin [Aestuariivirga sp.]
MTITVGDKLPAAEFTVMGADGQTKLSADMVFSGRKVVLIGIPGAFTPTCSGNHLPGYLKNYDAIKEKGVDTIACTAVNDVHVMNAWSKATGADGKILMLADGNGDFARALGLDLDLSAAGMGTRTRRYSMVVEDGTVTKLNVEEKAGLTCSAAENILEEL